MIIKHFLHLVRGQHNCAKATFESEDKLRLCQCVFCQSEVKTCPMVLKHLSIAFPCIYHYILFYPYFLAWLFWKKLLLQ